jgi:hypothetical protein
MKNQTATPEIRLKTRRNPWHRRATARNLVLLFEHGRITPSTRAKAARPVKKNIPSVRVHVPLRQAAASS